MLTDMHACTHRPCSHTYAAHTCTCSHKMHASTYIHAHSCRHAYVLMHTLAHTPHMQMLHVHTQACTCTHVSRIQLMHTAHAYTHIHKHATTRAHTQTKPGQCRPSSSPSRKDNIMAKENSLPFAKSWPQTLSIHVCPHCASPTVTEQAVPSL